MRVPITICTAILIKNKKIFALIFVQFSTLIVIIISNRVVFTPILNQDLEQGKLMAAVNSRK